MLEIFVLATEFTLDPAQLGRYVLSTKVELET